MKEKRGINLELKTDLLNRSKRWIARGEDEEFICIECEKPISEGFVCENNNKKVWCVKCGFNFPMHRCEHDEIGEHKHFKFTRVYEIKEDEPQIS